MVRRNSFQLKIPCERAMCISLSIHAEVGGDVGDKGEGASRRCINTYDSYQHLNW